MMVPDKMDMEHEVVKCGMFIVKEVNVLKRARTVEEGSRRNEAAEH